jgi:hypothetical protein
MDTITAIISGTTAAVISGFATYAMTRPTPPVPNTDLEPNEKICMRECGRVYDIHMRREEYMNCVLSCLGKKVVPVRVINESGWTILK